MTCVIRKAGVYVLHRDADGFVVRFEIRRRSALAWHDERPDVAFLITDAGTLDVTLDGMSLALTGEYDEPSGGVSMRPVLCPGGREWWVADVRTADSNAEYTIAAETVARFVDDVAATRRVAKVRAGAAEREWEPPVRRVEGGA